MTHRRGQFFAGIRARPVYHAIWRMSIAPSSEVPFDIHKLMDMLVADRRRNPSNYAIMTISEGAMMVGGDVIESGEADAYGHKKLGGIGEQVADYIKRHSSVNTMYQQLGYLMRSGAPDSLDRMVALYSDTGGAIDPP